MIVSTVRDRALQAAIRRAARPDEDVILDPRRVARALCFGFPRVAVQDEAGEPLAGADGAVPEIRLGRRLVGRWRAAWEEEGVPSSLTEFVAARLAEQLRAPRSPSEADLILRDLSRLIGRPLPPAFAGLARRVLEFPAAYVEVASLRTLTGVSPGALKARFRRRGLPSPHAYLRWLRCLAVAGMLRHHTPVADAARRLGWTTSGNLCRHVATTAGCPPSAMSGEGAREALLIRFVRDHLSPASLEAWSELDALFLRDVA